MQDYMDILIMGVGGGFSVCCIISLMGYGIYKSLKLIERS